MVTHLGTKIWILNVVWFVRDMKSKGPNQLSGQSYGHEREFLLGPMSARDFEFSNKVPVHQGIW